MKAKPLALSLSILFCFGLALVACAGGATTATKDAAAETPDPDPAAYDSAEAELGDESAEAKVFPLPDLPPAGGVIAYYYDNAMVELVSPQGVHVFIDVYTPGFLSREATSEDILLITHSHSDHYVESFYESFPGQKIFGTDKGYGFKDVTITVIPSAHNEGDPITTDKATNYLYLVDLGGFRVAHFGDIGQPPLSKDQLAKLGRVDLLFTQFANGYSGMDESSEMGFDYVAQARPRAIVPCHSSNVSHEKAKEKYRVMFSESPALLMTPAVFGDKPLYILMGGQGYGAGEKYAVPRYEEEFPALYK